MGAGITATMAGWLLERLYLAEYIGQQVPTTEYKCVRYSVAGWGCDAIDAMRKTSRARWELVNGLWPPAHRPERSGVVWRGERGGVAVATGLRQFRGGGSCTV